MIIRYMNVQHPLWFKKCRWKPPPARNVFYWYCLKYMLIRVWWMGPPCGHMTWVQTSRAIAEHACRAASEIENYHVVPKLQIKWNDIEELLHSRAKFSTVQNSLVMGTRQVSVSWLMNDRGNMVKTGQIISLSRRGRGSPPPGFICDEW